MLSLGIGPTGGGAIFVPPLKVQALAFPSAGDRYASTNIAFDAETPGTVRFRVRFTSVPGTVGFKWLAGFSAGGSGWLFDTEDTSGGLSVGQVNMYASGDGTLRVIGRKVILPEHLNTILTFHLLLDGSHFRWFLDGHEIGLGVCGAKFGSAYTSYDLPFVALGIGSRGSDGSFTTDQQIVELAISSTQMTQAQIAADAAKAFGASMVGETHHYTPFTGMTTPWNDATGTANLTRTGGPTVSDVVWNAPLTKRTYQCWGDSITAGRKVDLSLGDGWRRRLQKNCCAAGHGITIVGTNAPNGSLTKDYDYWHDGYPSQTLQTRLATYASDIANSAAADTGVVLAYGINDIAANRTSAQLAADVATACADIQASRPGVPIAIVNLLACNTLTGPQATQAAAYNAGFAAMITSLRGSGYNAYGVDVSGVVTNPADTSQLFDGTHPTEPYYDAMGVVIANAIIAIE